MATAIVDVDVVVLGVAALRIRCFEWRSVMTIAVMIMIIQN